jgi:hypothetical protein
MLLDWTINPTDEETEVPVSALVGEMSDQEAR